MNSEQLQNEYISKTFLIGLTFIDLEGNLIEQYQTHGTVKELTKSGLFKIKRNNTNIFQIPYDKDTIIKAEEGKYKERSTGKIIINPDFILSWEITTKPDTDLEELKKYGYIEND